MLASGNDAAVAIAGECGGMNAFVGKMNAKAAELGLTDTHFDNPNGLPSDTHYTTAHELAKITAAALKDPVFRQIVSTKSCTVSGHALSNHNRLLSMYDGAIGVKTGFTRAAGRCLVSAAERTGRTIIAVTLNDPTTERPREMLNAGFAQYSEVTLHKTVRLQTYACSAAIPSGRSRRIP
ncbi:MAG: D-alanyl-D-alanine carboxypeptidase family protein [Butyricicoccus sp.]